MHEYVFTSCMFVFIRMKGSGGHIHWYFSDNEIKNYRDAAQTNAQAYTVFA